MIILFRRKEKKHKRN